ncbi:MAG TPA: hypothetical protein VKR58_14270 [Aquella sp.]|nr:hypothetical protein [Aquella sp.]
MFKKTNLLLAGVIMATGLAATSFAKTCPDLSDKMYQTYAKLKEQYNKPGSDDLRKYLDPKTEGFPMVDGDTRCQVVWDNWIENHMGYTNKDFGRTAVMIADGGSGNSSFVKCEYGKVYVSIPGRYEGKDPKEWGTFGHADLRYCMYLEGNVCEFVEKK